MTKSEQREAARKFINKWSKKKGSEDEESRSFWIDLLGDVVGMDQITDRVQFEKRVKGTDGNTKKIEIYIPETKALIEQKSAGIKLDAPQTGHDGMTPYEQAKYYDNNLGYDEKAAWIITCNFREIWIYDMHQQQPEPVKIALSELQTKCSMLDFLVRKEQQKITKEEELSMQAGELVGKIHDRFLKQYNDPLAKRTQHSLNELCVRLVFCLYAEDAGLFGEKDAFQKYVESYRPGDLRNALIELFKVLDTPYEERADLYLSEELEAFPYVNGGLFANEKIIIPRLTQDIKDIILESAAFDWSEISPTIFGAVFESTLNPETRRSGGMHYTSIRNIHKVINPLFLDDLTKELEEIEENKVKNVRSKKLKSFQKKLASLQFLDPACGSGNFLTETYICLRRLENRVIADLTGGQLAIGDVIDPIQVSITQFHGIEINDFAVTVAKTALWIAESQMMDETRNILYNADLEFLPLKTNANIVEGNAISIKWANVVSANNLNYIMGNPPFLGYKFQTDAQKNDITFLFSDLKNSGTLDYCSCWYQKATEMMTLNNNIKTALVSTNSISQGEAVGTLWKYLFNKGVHIDFAYRTFQWDSEASLKAHVHCVIIGFSKNVNSKEKVIFDGNTKIIAKNINGYLLDAPNVAIEKRKGVLDVKTTPKATKGNAAMDNGFLQLTAEERDEILEKEPELNNIIYQHMSAEDFIKGKKSYCFWLKGVDPSKYRNSHILMKRLALVKGYRESSKRAATHRMAEYPMLFAEIRQPSTNYIMIPVVSSQRRRYIPMAFLPPTIINSYASISIPNATLYHFGILESNVHMSWMRTVCGRLKSDYRYATTLVYNTFPWPSPTDAQQQAIEKTAQGILDARALYPDSSLADLYDPLTMPPELRKAHTTNDIAVMKAYGFDIKNTSESDCVAALMRMYQEKVEEEESKKPKKK